MKTPSTRRDTRHCTTPDELRHVRLPREQILAHDVAHAHVPICTDTGVPELRDEPDLPLQLIESNLLPNSVALRSFNKATVERDPSRVGHGRITLKMRTNDQRI